MKGIYDLISKLEQSVTDKFFEELPENTVQGDFGEYLFWEKRSCTNVINAYLFGLCSIEDTTECIVRKIKEMTMGFRKFDGTMIVERKESFPFLISDTDDSYFISLKCGYVPFKLK